MTDIGKLYIYLTILNLCTYTLVIGMYKKIH